MRSLRHVARPGEFVRALVLRAERVLRRGQRLLACGDQRGEARLVGGKRRGPSSASSRAARAIDSRVLARCVQIAARASISDFTSRHQGTQNRRPRAPPADMSSGLTRMAGGALRPSAAGRRAHPRSRPVWRSSEAESSSAVAFRLANLVGGLGGAGSASCTSVVVSMQRGRQARRDQRRWTRFRTRSPGAAPPTGAACPRRRAARSPCPRAVGRSARAWRRQAGQPDRPGRGESRQAKRTRRSRPHNSTTFAVAASVGKNHQI